MEKGAGVTENYTGSRDGNRYDAYFCLTDITLAGIPARGRQKVCYSYVYLRILYEREDRGYERRK